MAIDASLIDAVNLDATPVLRIYAWKQPTLSLGYFQKLEDVADEAYIATHGVEVVRRPTGGGAILHDNELTFSLTLPASHPALKTSVNDSYLILTRPLLDFLRKSNIEAGFRGEGPAEKAANCFAGSACPDLVVKGQKVFGSAQRRKGNAVLMHGSLLLGINEALWSGVFGPKLGLGSYAAIDLKGVDWATELKKAYGEALGLAWD